MMLRNEMILLLLLLASVSNAQETYSNRWKEIKRTDRKDNPVAYTDTIRINDVTKESLKMRKGSFEYTGTISNDLLEIGEEQYQIIKLTATELIIGDDNHIHILARELKDMSAADAIASMNENALPGQPVASIDTKLFDGQWQTYKRQKKEDTKEKIRYGNMIKTISYMTKISQDGYDYVVTDSGIKLPIKNLDHSAIVVIDENKTLHRITIWKLTKEELVVEDENGILYYMKQF